MDILAAAVSIYRILEIQLFTGRSWLAIRFVENRDYLFIMPFEIQGIMSSWGYEKHFSNVPYPNPLCTTIEKSLTKDEKYFAKAKKT